jgi:hypothetical protein
MSAVYALIMLLNTMFGVDQNGKTYHMDASSRQALISSSEYQSFISIGGDIKFSGNSGNVIVIVDQNEM